MKRFLLSAVGMILLCGIGSSCHLRHESRRVPVTPPDVYYEDFYSSDPYNQDPENSGLYQ